MRRKRLFEKKVVDGKRAKLTVQQCQRCGVTAMKLDMNN